MRLQEMYHLVKHALDNWVNPTLIKHQGTIPQDIVYSCDNAREILDMLEPLQVLPSIQRNTEAICGAAKKFRTESQPYVSQRGYDIINNSMAQIKLNLLAMLDMCEALGLEPNTNGFDVKLPPNITLDEMADCIKDLNTIFSQCPLLRDDNDKIELRGVDVGSSWLVFTVLRACILGGLAALVDKAIQIRSHWITCKQQEELARKMKLGNDHLDALISANKAIIQKMTEDAVEQLSNENGITDPEDQGRLKHSLDLLVKLYGSGLEIYNAIDSPDEVKAVFPPVTVQTLPDNMPKLLIDAEESKEEK